MSNFAQGTVFLKIKLNLARFRMLLKYIGKYGTQYEA